ncbi:MAG: hypothetical protein J0H02_03510 [Armatimonadetes bacterium]|nr:hypothetical protein [Armatimonadota bacterium]
MPSITSSRSGTIGRSEQRSSHSLIPALAFHGIGTQMPYETWGALALPDPGM